MQLFTFFLLLNILSHKFHQRSVCSSSTIFFTPFFSANVWLHVTHRGLFFHVGSGSCDFFLTSSESSMFDLPLGFCHIVAHQHLTWAPNWLLFPFQNPLSYYGLQIFSFSFSLVISLCSITFYMLQSAFSNYSLVHSWQVDLHTS